MKEFDPHQQQAPPSIDDERMAALLDGRLDERARTEMIARLAGSEPDYRVFADAAAVLRDLEAPAGAAAPAAVAEPLPEVAAAADETPAADAAPTPVIRLRRRWWGMPAPAWGAIAAAVAALALIPAIRARGGGSFDPARLALQLQPSARQAPWTADTVLRASRGGDRDYEDEARSARLGVYLVDLDVAVRSRDTAVATLARTISYFLSHQVTGGGFLSPTYDSIAELAHAPPEQVAPLVREGWRDVAGASDESYFAAGAWLEAARLAAAARDAQFFSSRMGRAGLKRVEAMTTLSRDSRESVRKIRSALPAEGRPDWTVLDAELGNLIYTLGG